MKIVSWNCRYGLNEIKANAIRELHPDADIFVIQECKQADIDSFKIKWKYKNWYGDNQDLASDLGIAIFSQNYKVEFTDEFNRKFRYVVPYKMVVNNKPIILVVVWTKSVHYYYDQNVSEAVSYYRDMLLCDTVIIGDFNTGYSEENKKRYSNLCDKMIGFKNCALL